MATRSLSFLAIACWGVGGVVLLVVQAIWRLLPLALEPLVENSMSWWQLGIYVVWTLFNGYAEGYRGFQRSFSPRVVGRAFHLARHPRPLFVLLAPAYCMALFHAKRKNLVLAWGLVAFIVAAVALVRQLPQPWRGIVDAGVVIGLIWGVASLIVIFVVALARNAAPEHDSLPDEGAVSPGSAS